MFFEHACINYRFAWRLLLGIGLRIIVIIGSRDQRDSDPQIVEEKKQSEDRTSPWRTEPNLRGSRDRNSGRELFCSLELHLSGLDSLVFTVSEFRLAQGQLYSPITANRFAGPLDRISVGVVALSHLSRFSVSKAIRKKVLEMATIVVEHIGNAVITSFDIVVLH